MKCKQITVDIRYLKLSQTSGKFKILAFCKELTKPNTVFTSVLTLVSLKGNIREKIYPYFYSN